MNVNPEEERLLVCVRYGYTGRKLIKRGGHLARKLNADLTILIFDAMPDDEYAYHKEIDIPIFKQLAKEYGAKVIIKKARSFDITRVIAKAAEKEKATQIVIGQVVESVLTNLLGRSIVDVLLKKLPNADLHVVPIERSFGTEFDYDLGTKAYLLEKPDGTYHMTFIDPKHRAAKQGIFFKSLHTDFNNGIFAYHTEDDQIIETRVKENIVYSLEDIDVDEDH
ncbi:adenine nucleotide alpha hydrolase family protein [Alteribacillus iranensis]|uniref:Two-component system, OmpR family, sensor histidine kinase KdpD n=1 Tax=Alteribacillus iranensis TaxID=930128 RepID=A0A1I2B367_9BACI|nr:universal stress protein UspA [Alteribacillus iranensis]SFE50328.1 two-component system, OmpR family, sensor histidine kinase KdpD [Alteribacillus iranensis]